MPRGYVGRVVSGAEASRRWRERNPAKVRAAEHARPRRQYDKAKAAIWREAREHRPGYITALNIKANQRAIGIRRWLDAYKVAAGCVDCGYRKHHAALHFDHVRGQKRLNVCNAKSLAQAKAEIAKCEVRCANCHAERTFRRYL